MPHLPKGRGHLIRQAIPPVGVDAGVGIDMASPTGRRTAETGVFLPLMPDPKNSGLVDPSFELLVSSVTDYAIYMLDPTGRIVTWNAGAQRFKGYRADEIIGENFSRFFTPEDLAADLPARALATAAREGRYEAEGWRLRKDGSRFWANAVLDAIFAPDGALLGFAKITRDITEKMEADRALRDSEQRFQLLINSVSDYAIYMLDREGRVSNWNAGAALIKGYSADEIVGRHFSQFYTPEDIAAGAPEHTLATALRDGKYETEAQRVRKDGSLFWAHVVVDPIYDPQGKHVGFAKVTRDISERKRNEERLEEARAAVANTQKLQALGELTGGIAHDFNNLMTVISGSTELLLRRPDMSADDRQRHLEAIQEMAGRATRLTSHLLAYGRRQTLQPAMIDVNAHIRHAGEVLGPTLGNQIELVLDLPALRCAVEVDPGEFETALFNAALNARDAMPEGGRLTMRTADVNRDGSDCVAIVVEDTGMGMPDAVRERAFDPFFTTKEVGQGTGLGLSQIHGFAAQAGGHVELDSVEGQGTRVRIVLPCADRAAGAVGDRG